MEKYNSREEVPEKYKWDLTDYFKDVEEFDKVLEEINPLIDELKEYKGKLHNPDSLLDFIRKDMHVSSVLMNLDGYSMLKDDEVLGVTENISRKNKVLNLYTKYSENASFFEPEILSLSKESYEALFEGNKDLEEYRKYLDKIYRMKEHILSEQEEIIISSLTNAANSYNDIASNLLNSENDYGKVTLDDGETVVVAINNFKSLLRNKNVQIRETVYNQVNEKINEYAGTLASLLNSYCKLNDEQAKIHKFKNAWDRKLFSLNLSDKVFDTLVQETERNVNILHKYYELRNDVLGFKQNEYDLELPLNEDDKEYSIEEAQEITLEAIKPLGEDYYNHFKKIYDRKYIDYCQYKGKCSGAYSLSTYDQDSRILMSYNGNFSSISTIIHEGGHNVHHQYVTENNSIVYRMVPVIISEVMSLTNECLLSSYMVKHGKTKSEKLIGLDNIMGVIESNLYGAVREGKIEQEMYKLIEDGNPLTKDNLNKLVSDSLDLYYGDKVNRNELNNLSWARRSHYYMDYYLYAYAICISVATNVAKKILDGDKEMLDKYLKLIKTGSDTWTKEAFEILDIDLEDPNVYKNAFDYFDSLIEEYRNLM